MPSRQGAPALVNEKTETSDAPKWKKNHGEIGEGTAAKARCATARGKGPRKLAVGGASLADQARVGH